MRRRDGFDDPANCATVLDATARGLRAGLSLSTALDRAVQAEGTPPSLRAVVDAHHLGRPLAAALDDERPAVHVTALALTLTALATAARHGGASAEALDRTAATLRERAALAHEAQGHAAAARLSARVLTAVPLCFAAFAVVTDPRIRHVLLATPIGWACLVSGLTLNAIGRWWMNRIVAAVGGQR